MSGAGDRNKKARGILSAAVVVEILSALALVAQWPVFAHTCRTDAWTGLGVRMAEVTMTPGAVSCRELGPHAVEPATLRLSTGPVLVALAGLVFTVGITLLARNSLYDRKHIYEEE